MFMNVNEICIKNTVSSDWTDYKEVSLNCDYRDFKMPKIWKTPTFHRLAQAAFPSVASGRVWAQWTVRLRLLSHPFVSRLSPGGVRHLATSGHLSGTGGADVSGRRAAAAKPRPHLQRRRPLQPQNAGDGQSSPGTQHYREELWQVRYRVLKTYRLCMTLSTRVLLRTYHIVRTELDMVVKNFNKYGIECWKLTVSLCITLSTRVLLRTYHIVRTELNMVVRNFDKYGVEHWRGSVFSYCLVL